MSKPVIILPEFQSELGGFIEDFIREKMRHGYAYRAGMDSLRRLDRFLADKGLATCAFPKELVLEWTRKRSHEAPRTQQERFQLTSQFAKYLCQMGIDAYVPNACLQPMVHRGFAPYVFSCDELRRIFSEADQLPVGKSSSFRHLLMPELFRLLYGCGLRVNEALRLTMADSDLSEGVLTIRDAKFHKDRLVPVAPGLVVRLRTLQSKLGKREDSAYLFPSPHGGRYTKSTIYEVFRILLHRSGITHGGCGKGPRVHDLRHTHACHRLQKWYQDEVNLEAMLPVLAAYMGHKTLRGTQEYLHLTLQFAAPLTLRLDNEYGHIIPEGEGL